MLVNIHFNNIFASKTTELYLYQRLRWFAKDHGGSISGFPFSKTEKYDVFPKLLNNGWVTNDKVVKHRDLLTKYGCSNNSTRITEYDLINLDNFKAFLLSTCEAYVISYDKKKINKKSPSSSWDKKKGGESRAPSEKIENGKKGVIVNSKISKLMSISVPSITRWRRLSNSLSYNDYSLTANVYNPNSSVVERVVKNSRPSSGEYASLVEQVTVKSVKEKPKNGFKSNLYNGFVSYSLTVKTKLDIFVNTRKSYSGAKGLQ